MHHQGKSSVRLGELEEALRVERNKAARLTESEKRLRAVLDSAADGILTIDEAGRITSSNPAAERLFGYSARELMGEDVGLLMPERYRDKHHGALSRRITDPEAPSAIFGQVREAEGLKKDGSEFPLELAVTMVPLEDRLSFTGIVRDLSERREAERQQRDLNRRLREMSQELELKVMAGSMELAENQEMLAAILEGIRAGIVVFDLADGVVAWANERAGELTGREPGRMEGMPMAEAVPLQPDRPPESPYVAGDKVLDETGMLTRADGSRLPVSQNLLPLTREGRDSVVCILFDITRRRELERQLTTAQKLESIGQLAAGIAHEINTPIQYVGDNVLFLRDAFADLAGVLTALEGLAAAAERHPDLAGDVEAVRRAVQDADVDFLREEIPRAVEQCGEGVDRVGAIVRAMKRFSHISEGEGAKPADLNQAVESTIMVARNEWKYAAEMITDLDPDLPPVVCRLGDVNQALLNVIVNAAHAVAAASDDAESQAMGRITVTTGRRGAYAEITVTDTGTGIPEKLQDRIFDPFFTTKEVGRGTGQGLAIVHDIVERHQGTIEVRSSPGRGTIFTIRLPLAGPEAEAAPQETV